MSGLNDVPGPLVTALFTKRRRFLRKDVSFMGASRLVPLFLWIRGVASRSQDLGDTIRSIKCLTDSTTMNHFKSK